MKIILRNFLSVLRRYKLATILNVLGLSVAFAAFMVIMMQVDYDRNFDRHHPEADRIYRVETGRATNWTPSASAPIRDALVASSPHVQIGALADFFDNSEQVFFLTETGGQREFYREQFLFVTPEFTDLFRFDIEEGTVSLEDPETVLIPRSLASKLFGGEPATGKLLTRQDSSTYTVGGVYRDFPRNSSIPNRIYSSISKSRLSGNRWEEFDYVLYLRTDGLADPDELLAGIRRDGVQFRLTPLPEVHYLADTVYDPAPKTSRQTVFILLGIAFVIIVIAGINFTNFSVALTPKRVRNVNTQRVFGATKGVIRTAMVAEAVIISLTACLTAFGLVYEMQQTPLASLVEADISLAANLPVAGATFLIALATGVLAGLYPALYIVSFPVALALKGNFGLSPGGRRMRSVLVGVQFTASFALIIAASFMFLQNRYMLHSPLGYDHDTLIVAEFSPDVKNRMDAFTDRLKSAAAVESVAFTQTPFSEHDQFSRRGSIYRGEMIMYGHFAVSPSFLEVMGIPVTEGRTFREEDRKAPAGAFIFNEKARKEYDLELNERVLGAGMQEDTEIVGFVPDVKFASFRTAVEPMAFHVMPESRGNPYSRAYIRVKAGSDLRAAMTHVRSTLDAFDGGYPFRVHFFDEALDRMYEKEQQLGTLIALFSLVAVLIAIVGVFGLVVFDSEYRRKEIGIRKVFGSTTREILVRFNKSYVRILVLCFLPAAPLAWYAVARWLENFAYRTPMYWWVYAVAFAAVFVLTVATVTFQNWRAANANPIDSIKSE